MRGSKGKLICIWSPVLHGEGCSTLACALGFGIQHLSGKKVLIINKSNSSSYMEKYVEEDIEIKYSMDNLKIFNMGIKSEHILTYATQVNTSLYMIAGSRLNKEITKENKDFDKLLIDRCLEGFDIVIADIDTGVREENQLFLDRADNIIAVVTPNEIIMEELYKNPGLKGAFDCFTNEKTLTIINKLYDGWDISKVIGKFKNKYSLSKTFGLNYDGDILNSCCTDKNFYSFLMREIKREKNGFVKQLADICDFLVDALYMEKKPADNFKDRGLFKRLLRSSLF